MTESTEMRRARLSGVVFSPEAERRRLRLARATLASLEQRLQQKEQSCAEFRRLLAETRQQAEQQAEQHRQQQARSSDQLRRQVALVARSAVCLHRPLNTH